MRLPSVKHTERIFGLDDYLITIAERKSAIMRRSDGKLSWLGKQQVSNPQLLLFDSSPRVRALDLHCE